MAARSGLGQLLGGRLHARLHPPDEERDQAHRDRTSPDLPVLGVRLGSTLPLLDAVLAHAEDAAHGLGRQLALFPCGVQAGAEVGGPHAGVFALVLQRLLVGGAVGGDADDDRLFARILRRLFLGLLYGMYSHTAPRTENIPTPQHGAWMRYHLSMTIKPCDAAKCPDILDYCPVTFPELAAHLAAISSKQRRTVWVAAVVERIEDGQYDLDSLIKIIGHAGVRRACNPAAIADQLATATTGQVARLLVSIRDGKPLKRKEFGGSEYVLEPKRKKSPATKYVGRYKRRMEVALC